MCNAIYLDWRPTQVLNYTSTPANAHIDGLMQYCGNAIANALGYCTPALSYRYENKTWRNSGWHSKMLNHQNKIHVMSLMSYELHGLIAIYMNINYTDLYTEDLHTSKTQPLYCFHNRWSAFYLADLAPSFAQYSRIINGHYKYDQPLDTIWTQWLDFLTSWCRV